MVAVNMFEAKANLSKYVASVEEKKEPYIIILRNGKPVARIVPYDKEETQRIGAGKDQIPVMPELETFNSIDAENDFLGDGGLL